MEDSLMNVEIFVNEDSLDRAEDSLANKLPNVNLHNSSISIVNELSKVLKTIEVGTL